MPAELTTSELTPDERRREVVSILAAGLRRLRDRAALPAETAPSNPSESSNPSLEAVPANPLTVPAG